MKKEVAEISKLMDTKIKTLVQENFEVKNLIGPRWRCKTVADYISQNEKHLTKIQDARTAGQVQIKKHVKEQI